MAVCMSSACASATTAFQSRHSPTAEREPTLGQIAEEIRLGRRGEAGPVVGGSRSTHELHRRGGGTLGSRAFQDRSLSVADLNCSVILSRLSRIVKGLCEEACPAPSLALMFGLAAADARYSRRTHMQTSPFLKRSPDPGRSRSDL